MTLHVVRVWPDKSRNLFGLRHGRVVPIKRATIHPHPGNAERAQAGFNAKMTHLGITPPKSEIVLYANVREHMK